MVTIPASARSMTYNPASATGPFPIDFPLFDGTGADLYVTLDGVEVSGWAFTGTLESGFYGEPNTWINGSISFTAPISGQLVIDGRRDPRRQVQYAEGQGIPARDHNAAQNILTATDQELRRDVDRAQAEVDTEEAARAAGDSELNARVDREIVDRANGDKAVASLIGQAGPIEVPNYDTRLAAELAIIKPTILAIETGGGLAPGDTFERTPWKSVPAEPSHVGKFLSNEGTRWWELSRAWLTPETLRQPGDTEAQAIQRACDAVMQKGGGIVVIPDMRVVTPTAPMIGSGGTTPDDYVLHLFGDNVHLRGDPKQAGRPCGIKHDPAAPYRRKLVRMTPLPVVNGQITASDMSVEDLEFDGSFYYTPGALRDGTAPLSVNGIDRLRLKNLFIHHSGDYLVACQNGGMKDWVFENLYLEDCMADAIDVKNNGNSVSGGKMRGIWVKRFGRGYEPATSYAGLDVMGPGWHLSDIHVSDFGDIGTVGAGLRFKQGEESDGRGDGGNYGSLSNFFIDGLKSGSEEPFIGPHGVILSARNVSVSDGYIHGCKNAGMYLEQEGSVVSNVIADECTIGLRIATGPRPTPGRRTSIVGYQAINNSEQGFNIGAPWVAFANCIANNNGVGVQFFSAATDCSWVGGAIYGNAVQVRNNALRVKMRDVAGYETRALVESDPHPITTVGTATYSVPHGLPFTPLVGAVQATLRRLSNNTPSNVAIKITGANATTITYQVAVVTASVVPGDTCTFLFSIDPIYLTGIA